MENKKLIKILLKDMGELEELIAEVKLNRQLDAPAMEFIHTRARGVLQLLHILESQEKDVPGEMNGSAVTGFLPKEKPVEGAAEPGEIMPVKRSEEDLEIRQPVTSHVVEELKEEPERPATDYAFEIQVSGEDSVSDDDMLEEDTGESHAGARLGDSFLKGRSINDMITDQQNLEFKLSNRPVVSIQAAIGINDRFQYIRELFDGSNDKFTDAVKTLDSMGNIHDAVNYLRINYKWKKNETSIKFLNLIKRRFLND